MHSPPPLTHPHPHPHPHAPTHPRTHTHHSEISPARIESLLHLSIQISVAGADPYKDGVSSTFVKCVGGQIPHIHTHTSLSLSLFYYKRIYTGG